MLSGGGIPCVVQVQGWVLKDKAFVCFLIYLCCCFYFFLSLAPPNPPIGVMVRSSADDHTHNNLFLSWSPPATETTEAPVSGYKVQATPLPTTYGTATLVPGMILENSACIEVVCEGVEEVVGGRGSGSVTLTSLLPGLTYNFTVSSLSHGLRLQSMPSETIYRTNNGGTYVGGVDS